MLPLRSKDWGEQTAQRLEISYREGFKPPQRFSVFDLKPAPGQEDAQDSIAWDAVDTSELDIPRQEWEQRFGDIWDESMGSIVNNGFVSNKPDSDTVYVSLVIDPYLMRTLQRTLEDKLPANIREKIRWNQSSRFNLNEFWVKPGNGQAVKKAIENLRFENLPDAPVFRMGTPRLHNKALMVPVRFSAGADAVQDELVSPVEAALADRVNPSRNFTGGLFLGYLDDNEKLSSEEYAELQLILERLFEGDWGKSTAVSLKVRGKIGGNIAVQKKFELGQETPAASDGMKHPGDSPVRRLFAATFMYETLTEKLSLMAQAVRAKKISVLSRKKPILAETIDLHSFNGGMVRLAGTDRNYFKEQALKGTDTFVLSGLSAVLKDKAGMKYLPQVIANAKAANVRIVFDHDITADEIRNGQLKDNVQQMLAHGFDGYRLRYDGDEPAGLASQLSGLLRDTYISNAAAVVALPYNGTPFGKELEALATEYNLYRLALFDPKDQQRKLQADRLPENAWVEMVPREYVNDTAGAEAFKNHLKYLMGLPGARVIGIDSGIISQGEHRIFSGISDFVDYFAGLFAARVAQLRKTPDFRYESGRANALNIADKDVPSFGDEQAALLNLLNDQRSLAGKAENERAPLMDRMLLNLSVVLLSNRTGDSLNRLEKLYKEAAAETNDTEKELIIAEIAGFIRGLLEKDAVRHLLLVRNKAFASPKYAEMYGWGVVEARLQMERTPEGKKIEEKKINEKIDDNYERFHAPLKDYAKSAVFELSMNDLKQTSNELARIKELGDYLDDLETRGTPAELGKESVSRISELYFYVQHGKPGTRPVALAELLKVLELYADKQSSFDPAKLKDTSKKMIYDVIGIKAVESAA
jgi:hypothetical protein